MTVEYKQNQNLILHHAYKVTESDLLNIVMAKSHSSPTLYWADGISFFYEQVPPIMSVKIEEDFINGKDHWSEVFYAEVKKYTDIVELMDGEYKGAKIRSIDASTFAPHKDFAKWANSQSKK